MERFEQLKKELLARAKAADACTEQYSRALHAETLDALLDVVRDNFGWAVRQDVIDGKFIDLWQNEFAAGRIWHNSNVEDGFLLATEGQFEARGNSTVKAWGNATVEAGGNSTVEAWGNATVEAGGNSTVKAWGNATVEARDNATVKAWDNATVEAWGNSTVEAWGNSTVKAWGNATVVAGGNATVKAWGNATVKAWGNATVVAGGNAYITSYDVIECELRDHAIYRIRRTNTIRYADKGMKFQLVEE